MSLFEYTDYRAYLKDFYEEQKRKSTLYSYRVFANKAKLASPNYLKLVIDGARRITDKNLPNFVRGLRLSGPEADYFRNLVFFQEAKDDDARQLYQSELSRMRARQLKVTYELDRARLEFLRSWHHCAVRELVLLDDFQDNPNWIAKRLRNRITPKQAQESLELLLKLEFIKRVENGRYILSQPLITTSDEISSQMIRDLHRQFNELGTQSIVNDPLQVREINGLTIALPRDKVPEFKNAIKEFRKELNKSFSGTSSNQEVYHLVINFFPLTKEGDRP